jgi:arylformamidase
MTTPIFRGYDRAALDREYDNRKKVANAADVLAWYARESAWTREKVPARLDVAYGPHPGERLDIFPPTGKAGRERELAPVQVFIHGGYWHRLDKADFSYVARGFAPAGAATVVINYALMPTVTLTELVRQCRAAIAWVHAHARNFGGDPDAIFVSGHSAGGHLVAVVMATRWAGFGALDGLVKGGASISGLHDLEPIRLCYLNDILALTPDDVERWSPVRLPAPPSGRLLLAVGELEGPEYHRQTDDLAAAWRGRGLAVEVLDMAGHDHFSIAVQLGDPGSPLARAILGQMGLR